MDNETSKEAIVIKANDLLEKMRSELTPTQYRIISYAISMLSPEDQDFKDLDIPIKDLLKFTRSESFYLYSKLRKEARELFRKPLEFEDSNGWIIVNWFSLVQYLNNKGILRVHFDPFLKPYLLQLKDFFTVYKLRYIEPLRSYYSQRFYEWLKEYDNMNFKDTNNKFRKFSLDWIATILDFEKRPSFYTYGNFKRFVLKPAIEDINKYTDLQVLDLKEHKFSRKVVGFTIFFRDKTPQELEDLEEAFNNEFFEIETEIPPSVKLSTSVPAPSEAPEPAKEALASVVKPPESDSDMQERRLNYFYLQVPENHRNSSVRDVLKQFLDLPDEKIISNIKYTIKQNPENFAGYLYKALENDYAKEEREENMPQEEKKKLKAEWWKQRIDEAILTMSEEEKKELLHFVDVAVQHKEIEDTPEARERAFRNFVKQELEMQGVKCPYED